MKISYECSELIEELEDDIAEFGDINMYAYYEKINESLFLVNYDFINDEKPLTLKEIKNCVVCVEKASKILETLKKQNSII